MSRRSVHFGLNRVNPDFFGGWTGDLIACAADAADLTAKFAAGGYSADAFLDSDCTLEQLRRSLRDAAALSVPGDTFVFTTSGHGSQAASAEWGDTEEGLCCFDGICLDSEFRHLIAQFQAGVDVIAILDICHASGLAKAAPGVVRPRVAPLKVTRRMKGNPKPIEVVPGNAIILGACEQDQLSLDGEFNGAFTGALLETLPENIAWKKWLADCSRLMSRQRLAQNPELVWLGGSGVDGRTVF